jgi:hypothetical protein
MPSIPMVSVTVNTNCRFGPGQAYEYLGALLEGETAELVGRDDGGNFWVISNPDNPGEHCWITAAYAQVSGDTSVVPVMTPPPTPTNTPVSLNFVLDEPVHLVCDGDHFVNFRVRNTGAQALSSFHLDIEDFDMGAMFGFTGSSFRSGSGCVSMLSDSLDPGGEAFIQFGSFSYDPYGHSWRISAKMFRENGLGGAWVEKVFTQTVTGVSDAAQKENRRPVEGREVLERLLNIPVETWNYIAQPDAIRHMGPMAQDFFEAYGLGVDDRLSAIDVQGVALASIQALHEIVEQKDAQIVELEARLTELEGHVAKETPEGLDYLNLLIGVFVGVALVIAIGWIWWRRRLCDT